MNTLTYTGFIETVPNIFLHLSLAHNMCVHLEKRDREGCTEREITDQCPISFVHESASCVCYRCLERMSLTTSFIYRFPLSLSTSFLWSSKYNNLQVEYFPLHLSHKCSFLSFKWSVSLIIKQCYRTVCTTFYSRIKLFPWHLSGWQYIDNVSFLNTASSVGLMNIWSARWIIHDYIQSHAYTPVGWLCKLHE